MRINIEKTEGTWLGPYKDYPEHFEGIFFSKRPIRCLGIYIGHDKEGCYRENWLRKINKLQNCLHVWKSRKLTLMVKYGKEIVNINVCIYFFSILHVPK